MPTKMPTTLNQWVALDQLPLVKVSQGKSLATLWDANCGGVFERQILNTSGSYTFGRTRYNPCRDLSATWTPRDGAPMLVPSSSCTSSH